MKKNAVIIIFISILFIGGLGLFLIPKKDKVEEDKPTTPEVQKPTPETVSFIIHVDSEASDSEIKALQENISKLDIKIDNLTLKTKEEVRQELIKKGGSEGEAAEKYTPENNPLDHQLLLKVNEVTDKEALKRKIEIFINVTKVEY